MDLSNLERPQTITNIVMLNKSRQSLELQGSRNVKQRIVQVLVVVGNVSHAVPSIQPQPQRQSGAPHGVIRVGSAGFVAERAIGCASSLVLGFHFLDPATAESMHHVSVHEMRTINARCALSNLKDFFLRTINPCCRHIQPRRRPPHTAAHDGYIAPEVSQLAHGTPQPHGLVFVQASPQHASGRLLDGLGHQGWALLLERQGRVIENLRFHEQLPAIVLVLLHQPQESVGHRDGQRHILIHDRNTVVVQDILHHIQRNIIVSSQRRGEPNKIRVGCRITQNGACAIR
mmetsp:Transcript_9428/g.19890  ORF Transcript_9428/g.19890 Transcript_9428/m.19890 type:complete len:288 (+) Transcript_9428:2529-3392(+)